MKICAITFLTALAIVTPALAADPDPIDSVVDGDIFCIRASRVGNDLATRFSVAQPTNTMAGTVLDLRFADGNQCSDEAVINYFSTRKSPLVILVNGQTRGEAAALAERLRAAGACLLIGSTNTPGKIQPDIVVAESATDEKKFQDNPYADASTNDVVSASASSGLLPFVDHTSEAELVRKNIKDGEEDGNAPTARAEPPPIIRDPALARAVDLLKALAILHKPRG